MQKLTINIYPSVAEIKLDGEDIGRLYQEQFGWSGIDDIISIVEKVATKLGAEVEISE